MDVESAPDVQAKVDKLLNVLGEGFGHVNFFRIICMRSRNTSANAYARIWNLPDIWQKALSVSTFYIIEVVTQHYDKLSPEEQEKVLIHELLHIPKTFSGALLPHSHPGGKVDKRTVDKIYAVYKKKLAELGGQGASLE